jgi:hypothetical protein
VALWLIDGANPANPLLASKGVGSLDPAVWTIFGTGDFNKDGRGDILWRATDGSVLLWILDGNLPMPLQAARNIGTSQPKLGPEWVIAGVGDFNTDGYSDILWFNTTTRMVKIWLIDWTKPDAVLSNVDVGVLAAGWSIIGTGDFDADNRSDILLLHTSGGVGAWLMNGGTILNTVGIGTLPAGWTVVETGDFDGNRHTDLLLLHAASNSLGIWLVIAEQKPPLAAALGVGSLPAGWQVQTMNAD